MPKILPQVEITTEKKIAPSDLRLLWVNDWYDGPLEAVVELAGARCLMVLHDETPAAEKPYRWLIIRLSDEQTLDQEKLHALFVAHVGDHWCFHGDAIMHPPPTDEPEPEKFFGPYRERPPLDISGNTVVGWADEMPEH